MTHSQRYMELVSAAADNVSALDIRSTLYDTNEQQPSSDTTHGIKIEDNPGQIEKTPIVQFAYAMTLKKELLITSPCRLTLEQMQELQRRFEDQEYQVEHMEYKGVVEK